MKRFSIKIVILFVISMLVSSTVLADSDKLKATGIGFRGSYWNISNGTTHVNVAEYGNNVVVNAGGGGGWLAFYSRLNHDVLMEFAVGAVARVKVREENTFTNEAESDVTLITPLVMGLRFELVPYYSNSSMRPYLSLGAGPYWISEIHVKENSFEEEVTMDTHMKRAGYLGGGFNLMLNSFTAVNLDLRYHFIDFNVNHDYSGYEIGLGLNFMWGNFKNNSNNR